MNKSMISEFQCPGCTCGSAPCEKCESFKPGSVPEQGSFFCESWSAGTFMFPGGNIMLGLPKGFNKVGPIDKEKHKNIIRLWDKTKPEWDHLNVAVWAVVKDGYLFVRTYCPRVNVTYVDVVKGGKDIPAGAIDVGKFIDEID